MRIDVKSDQTMQNAAGRRIRRTPWLQLLSALLDLADGKAELQRHSERTWASVTFSGTRHTVVLCFTGSEAIAAGEALIELLPDHEFTIPGQLVADANVTRAEQTAPPSPRLELELEVLMLDEV